MTDIMIEFIKTRVTAHGLTFQHKWTMEREKIKPKFTYQRGNPAGYTDDLGIIADKNQWVEYQPSGYRSAIDPQDYKEMREWCEQNLKGPWYTGIYFIFIKSEKDVAWFMLRWS